MSNLRRRMEGNSAFQVLVVGRPESDHHLLGCALPQREGEAYLDYAETPDQLRRALRDRAWDVVFLDCQLESMDLLDAVNSIKTCEYSAPVVLFSSDIDDKLGALIKSGADHLVSKYDLNQLEKVIRKIRHGFSDRRDTSHGDSRYGIEERRYRNLIESSPIPVVVHDLDQRILFINQALLTALGATSSDRLLDQSLFRFIHPDSREAYVFRQHTLEHDEKPSNIQDLRLVRFDERMLEVEAVTNLIEFENKPAVQMAFLDVTERRQADAKLRQAAAVFESTSEGVLITDPQGSIVAVNRAFTDITGFSEKEALGRRPSMLKSGRHDENFYESLWDAVKNKGQWRGEIWNRRKNGEIFPEWLTISSVRDERDRVTNFVAVFSDITHLKRSQEKLEHLAHFDPLTDLPNRLLFQARLAHARERANRDDGMLAILSLGLDRFKLINDTLGHPVGDLVLQEVSRRLSGQVREYDTVARTGGDEFSVLLEFLSDAQDAAMVAQKILGSFNSPFQIGERELFLSASIGISMYPDDGDDVDALTKNAITALYRAKDQGKDNYQFYSAEFSSNAFERFFIETHLRFALSRDEILLYYQPQIDTGSGRLVGIEALVRWQHPDMGLISPTQFIPLAEESGLIIPIGEWILREACAQAKEWMDKGLFDGRMAVNLSGYQIQRIDLVDTVKTALHDTGYPAGKLQLEVTEGFIMDRAAQSIEVLRELRGLGLTLAIDDFGTGYSSLSYLKRLPVNKLKIDKSFIRDIPQDSDNQAIIRAIISLGSNMGLDVIAEGVETQAQLRFLKAEGCAEVQGYLYGRPVPAKEFQRFLERETRGTGTHA